jgi:O-acetyl-ADP-ribose deacetylase
VCYSVYIGAHSDELRGDWPHRACSPLHEQIDTPPVGRRPGVTAGGLGAVEHSMIQKTVNGHVVKAVVGDITDLEIDAFVYHARRDLVLGSGFGGAIAVRGGPSVQAELKKIGSLDAGGTVVTSAGRMKAKHIIHAVGPVFQEEDEDAKLAAVTVNVLRRAEEHGITHVAFPALGAGFYGMPLDRCARILVKTVSDALRTDSPIREIVFCLRDNREYRAFAAEIEKLGTPDSRLAIESGSRP